MAKFLVVIVNWQRPLDTIECIHSLIHAKVSISDILLVDNGSLDSSIEQITSALPDIQIECLEKNLGYAGGYNAGITRALQSNTDYIFLLNNDTTVESGAIEAMLDAGWDVVIPKILFYNQPEMIWAAGAHWRLFPPAVVMNGFMKPDGPAYSRPKTIKYATGCAIFACRQVFQELGGFDQTFESYMEDYDLFYRIHAAGYKVGYVPQAHIYHKVSQTLGSLSPDRWHFLGRNTVLFYRKDKRFPLWMLWSYLGWFIVRELIKGNSHLIPAFWGGIQEGLELLKSLEKAKLGKNLL